MAHKAPCLSPNSLSVLQILFYNSLNVFYSCHFGFSVFFFFFFFSEQARYASMSECLHWLFLLLEYLHELPPLLFFRATPWHMEVPRLGVPIGTAAAVLYDSLWQCWILTPLSEVRDRNFVLMDISRVCY